jgi:UDP-glucose 4-epimerase
MNILITGGNGFLGSNVAKHLHKNGHRLYIFSKNTSNIEEILPEVWLDRAHTQDLSSYRERIVEFEPDVVIHFGWSGGNSYADINSITQLTENVQAGVEFIQLLSTLPKKPKFIGLGSFAEYGYHDQPLDETAQEAPINLYGLSKYTFKNYSKMLCELYGMEWGWIRPCYTYGPGDVQTRLIPSLISKFLLNEAILLDECATTIDYLYVEDFAKFIYPVITTKATGVYNVCSSNQYKLRDVISLIKELSCSTSNVQYDPSKNRTNISNFMCGDNTRINKLTNLKTTDLTNGILKTIQYEKSRNTLHINRK